PPPSSTRSHIHSNALRLLMLSTSISGALALPKNLTWMPRLQVRPTCRGRGHSGIRCVSRYEP
ncbi:hypothetical protein BDZ89DRAFT_1072916, partial [Hymenopellis radicata]